PRGGPPQRADDPAGEDQGTGDSAEGMSDQQTVPSAAIAEGVIAGDRWVSVPRDRIRESLQELKADGFRSYLFMTCVDHLATPDIEKPPERFELVYQLRDMERRQERRLRVFGPESD